MSYTQQDRFLDFFAQYGVTHVNFSTLSLSRDGSRHVMKGDVRPRDRSEIERCYGWAWHENQKGAGVFVRPARFIDDQPAAWPMLFLDDLDAAAAAAIAGQYRCAIVQTSPGRHQAWIVVDRALHEHKRAAAQRNLARRFGGDFGSISGEHFGRMPGYKHSKPERGGCWINIVTESTLPPLIVTKSSEHETPAQARMPRASRVTAGVDDSESGREFGWVLGRMAWALRSGRADDELPKIRQQIAEQAAARGKPRPGYYADVTVKNAAQQLGINF